MHDSSLSSRSSMCFATNRPAIFVLRTVSLSRDGSRECIRVENGDQIDARYPKRESMTIPARHAFSNAPRMRTIIDKTIRKLLGLLEIIGGSRRSVRNIVLRFSLEPILCDFFRGNKGKTIVCVIGNLFLAKK